MKDFFVDLHIHIGAGRNGEPVKITASRKLNFANIAAEALNKKGLDMVGVIDCASPLVIADVERLLARGEMIELAAGGLKYRDRLVIIPGAEIESREKDNGQAHYLAYFPLLDQIKEFSQIMDQYITNINLSSQSTGLTGREILQIVDGLGGILIPAHVFTPHKSFYGASFSTYSSCFTEEQWDKIPAIELGLSADTRLADYLNELKDKTFLSNSDAHSLGKIAREYNEFHINELNFREFELALKRAKGRRITVNYGLDPRLGKYHRSFCPDCQQSFPVESPVLTCPECNGKLVTGVKDRILEIADKSNSDSPVERPPYVHQVPLADIPGIGPKTLQRLLNHFGTEMAVIHETSLNDLCGVVSKKIAENIMEARSGKARIKSGGGGNYGKIVG